MLDQALSLFSPVKRLKRSSDEQAPAPSTLKRPRPSMADIYAHLDAIERLQSRLLSVDKDCLREQLEVQRTYDAKKIPLLAQRGLEISKIPDFWVTAIGNHPFTNQEAWISGDRDILSYLESIDLEDNLDDHGSYTLRFSFSEKNPFFSNHELTRSVTILEDQSDVIHSSPILWAPGRRCSSHPKSFFAWFTSTESPGIEEDFGEILRRDLWQNPYPYYLNLSPGDPVRSTSLESQE